MTLSPMDQFRDAIRAAGINPPDEIIADGAIHRFASNGHRHDDAGWYIYFDDGIPAGEFGDWRTGHKQGFRADIGRKPTAAELEAERQRIAAAKKQREAEEQRLHDEARQRADELWSHTWTARGDHGYLKRKGIGAHGVKLHRGALTVAGMDCNGALVVPMRDTDGVLHSLQFIAPEKPADGDDKRYLRGGRVTGCYYAIGEPNRKLCIAEGFATAASIHEATGEAVAVAFSAGNLESVARELHEKYPDLWIVLCADDDYRTEGNPGFTKATEAARAVGGLLAVPDFGGDRPEGATDFNDLAQHRGAEAVKRAIAGARAPDEQSPQPKAPEATAADSWPDPMDDAAFIGIAGEFVRMTEPNTEADPVAILVQFLAAFGALIGRGPHYRVEGDEHHANLYALLVGPTAKGRKGTAWGRVHEPFKLIPGWKAPVTGLATGEGLKYHVRDATEGNGDKPGDPGVPDKRLLAVQSEFASTLRVAARDGNTLSTAMREAWDSGNLRTLTKNDPVVVTGAHIAIIGHITADELRAELTATDAANGFANRFLFAAVRRSKLLPFGGDDGKPEEVLALAQRLRALAETARTRQRVEMTEDARAVWAKVYPVLAAGGDGLHGAVTARAEAQVCRLALVYALLDGADAIDVPHLLAALAVWNYCDATAKFIWGASLGDRIADEIMRRLRQAGAEGLTRTEIRDLFGRNHSAERIGAALELLQRKGHAMCETVKTEGRPKEVWKATK